MPAQNSLNKSSTSSKIQKLMSVFPWASTKYCEITLQMARGNINGACHILAERSNQLSDDEEIDMSCEPTPFVISDSTVNPSYELTHDPISGFTLTQPRLSTTASKAISVEDAVEVTLPRLYRFDDLQEARPGIFLHPPGTKFSTSTKLAPVSFSSLDSADEHKTASGGFGKLPSKNSESFDSHIGQGENNTAFSAASIYTSATWSWTEDMMTEPLTQDTTLEKPVTGQISGSVFLMHGTSSGFARGDSTQIFPFLTEERDCPLEKRRREFVAAAVIRAALPKTLKPSWAEGWGSASDSDESFNQAMRHPKLNFKKFGMGIDLFSSWHSAPISRQQYIGTNKGGYMPVPWKHTSESTSRGYLQFINATSPYDKFSFEELRLGDYIRGRTKAPHHFSLFEKLPLELRLMIWRYAREPRVVEFRFDDSNRRCWSPCPSPALLQICQESRKETLRFCQPTFRLGDQAPRIYFDSAIDSLFLTFENSPIGDMESMSYVEEMVDQLLDADLAKVQNLAVDMEVWDCWNHIYEAMRDDWLSEDTNEPAPPFPTLPRFTNLKKLDLVQNEVIGLWRQRDQQIGVNDLEEEDFASDSISFIPLPESKCRGFLFGPPHVRLRLKGIQEDAPKFSIPTLSFMQKIEKLNE